MVHSDDKGLVLPPKLAPFQVVIVPIGADKGDEVMAKAEEIAELLTAEGIRVKLDTRDNMRPGAKFFEWEKKGVPVRIEIGPKDLAANQVTVVRRDTAEKQALTEEGLMDAISDMLEQIQLNLLERARAFRDANTLPVQDYDEFKEKLEGHFLLAHWCGSAECEAKIKEETKATIRCIPFEGPAEKGKCILCGKKSDGRVIFAKAY
jgi:prolyl-tRNA synthetase